MTLILAVKGFPRRNAGCCWGRPEWVGWPRHPLTRSPVRCRIDLFPVNYLAHDGALYFRSAPGSKLAQITANRKVAFEVDNPRGRTR